MCVYCVCTVCVLCVCVCACVRHAHMRMYICERNIGFFCYCSPPHTHTHLGVLPSCQKKLTSETLCSMWWGPNLRRHFILMFNKRTAGEGANARQDMETVCSKFEYFTVKRNIIHKRMTLQELQQQDDETVEEFFRALRSLVVHCRYKKWEIGLMSAWAIVIWKRSCIWYMIWISAKHQRLLNSMSRSKTRWNSKVTVRHRWAHQMRLLEVGQWRDTPICR